MKKLPLYIVLSFLFGCNQSYKKSSNIIECYKPNNSGLTMLDTALQKITMRKDTSHNGMQLILEGNFLMGATANEMGFANEYPQHKVQVNAFWMDATEVTNAEFAAFVAATHYITTAERKPDWDVMRLQLPLYTERPPDSLLIAGSLVFTPTKNEVPLNDAAQW